MGKSISKIVTTTALGLAMLGALTLSPVGAAEKTVVFVCEHGSSRSLLAASLFNRMAEERGLSVRALSRAASEKTTDQKVPAPLAKQMAADGFQVEDFKPAALTPSEASTAAKIVTLQFNESLEAAKEAPVERWSDIGSPSREYDKTKGTISSHIGALLDQLKGGADASSGKQK
jgi:arsenate reductase